MLQRIPALILLLLLAATANAQTANMPGVVSSADTGKPILRIGVAYYQMDLGRGEVTRGQLALAGARAGINAYQPTGFLAGFNAVQVVEKSVVEISQMKPLQISQMLANENLAGLIYAGECGPDILKAAECAEQAGVPFLTVTPPPSKLTVQGWRNVWCVHDTPLYAYSLAAHFIFDVLKAGTVYIVHLPGEENETNVNTFVSHYQARGGVVLGRNVHTPSGPKEEYKAILSRIHAAQPDALFLDLHGAEKEAAFMGDFTHSTGSSTSPKIVGGAESFGTNIMEALQGYILGMYASQSFFDQNSDPYKMFLHYFHQRTEVGPDDYKSSRGTEAYAYDAAFALLAAIDRAGTTDPAAVRRAMLSLDYQGATKRIRFDGNGNCASNLSMYRMDGTKWSGVYTPSFENVRLAR